jgi:hypothetical protein
MELAPWVTPYLYVVQSRLVSGAEEAPWNEWYDGKHIPDLLTVPGFRSARRYSEIDGDGYLAVYEIESPAVFEEARYREVTGWGKWYGQVAGWTRTIAHVETNEVKLHDPPTRT